MESKIYYNLATYKHPYMQRYSMNPKEFYAENLDWIFFFIEFNPEFNIWDGCCYYLINLKFFGWRGTMLTTWNDWNAKESVGYTTLAKIFKILDFYKPVLLKSS